MSEFKSTTREEIICISYYDTEDLPIDRHCIKYRNIKYDIQDLLERIDDIDYVISDSKTTQNLLKKNKELKQEIESQQNRINKAIEYVKCNYLTDSPLQFKIDLIKILEGSDKE